MSEAEMEPTVHPKTAFLARGYIWLEEETSRIEAREEWLRRGPGQRVRNSQAHKTLKI